MDGAEHAAQRGEQIDHVEPVGRHYQAAGLDLREVEPVVDPRMNWICFSCSAVSGPSRRSRSRRTIERIAPSGVRNSWLMYDRNRLFSSVAWRSASLRSSSSEYRAPPPAFVSA